MKQMQIDQDLYGFLELYFPGLDETPFSSGEEQWKAWERFIDMLCMISIVMKEKEQPESLERIGCLLNDAELMKALEPRTEAAFPHRDRVREIFDTLLRKGRIAIEGKGPLPLWQFLNTGYLQPVEMAAFLFAACVDRNRKYERVFGVLKEDTVASARPTVGLTHDLCSLFLQEEENSLSLLLEEDSFLNRFLLAPVQEDRFMSRLSRPLSLQPQALSVLLGGSVSLGCLSSCAQLLEEADTTQVLCHEEQLERLNRVFTGMATLEETGIIRLEGIAGVGKKFLMQALGDSLHLEVLCIHVGRLLSQEPDTVRESLRVAVLKAVYENTILYLEGLPSDPEGQRKLPWMLTFLQDYVRRLIVGCEKPWPDSLKVRGSSYLIPVNTPGAREQKEFWNYFAKENLVEFHEDVVLEELVSRYDMTPEKIRQTLLCATLAADAGQEGFLVTKEALEEEIRHQCSSRLGEYATRIESPFTWADLQLSEESRKLLEAARDRILYRSAVQDTFGFGKKLPYGNGTSIVFYGPPGTGKTMAAQVFAKELGLDIYRIDLSQIGSKYIGETEKNLGAVFDAARFSNAVLFFDEADALFTKRTEVSSSNDKYANAETAYLLQKIEEYSGVSILATNIMQNFDSAFKRRMTFMIPVEQPDEATRLLLWQKVFPEETPLEKDIDFAVYAKIAELTGSNIKSAALAAAYRAAAEHRSVSNRDLIEAVDFEYRRTGRMGISNSLYSALYMRT